MFDFYVRWLKLRRGRFPRHYKYCYINAHFTFSSPENISLGRWIHIGPKSFIEAKGGISIGYDTIISSRRVTILSSSHNYNSKESIPYGGDDILKPARIGRIV